MRASAMVLAVLAASLTGGQAAHAQSNDKAQAAATTKPQTAAKAGATPARTNVPAAQARGGTDAGKAKIEGVSTMRSTPADSKKGDGCSHSMASDA